MPRISALNTSGSHDSFAAAQQRTDTAVSRGQSPRKPATSNRQSYSGGKTTEQLMLSMQRIVGNHIVRRAVLEGTALWPDHNPGTKRAGYSGIPPTWHAQRQPTDGSPRSKGAMASQVSQNRNSYTTPESSTSREAEGVPRSYALSLQMPPTGAENHANLNEGESLRTLRNFANRIRVEIEGGIEGHRQMKKLREEQYIVGSISDTLGGVRLPLLKIWDEPRAQLAVGDKAIAAGSVVEAAQALQRAAFGARWSSRAVHDYREGTIGGAERATTGLEIVQVAAAATVTIGTGGAAGIFVGAGYGGAQAVARQASEVHYGLRERIDWSGIGFDTAFGLITGYFGGQLGNAVVGRLLRNPAAASLGRRALANIVSDFVSGRSSSFLNTAGRTVFDQARGAANITPEEFIDRLADQLTDSKGILLDLIMGAATRRATAKFGRDSQSHSSAAEIDNSLPATNPAGMPMLSDVQSAVPHAANDVTKKGPKATDSPHRVGHLNEPVIEPGVVASTSAKQGHKIKVLQDGRVVLCSTCGTVRNAHLDKLDLPDPQNPGRTYRHRLDAIEAHPNAQVKAELAAKLNHDLSNLKQVQVNVSNHPDIVPNPPIILEFPDGTRVWRDTVGGPIHHESAVRAGSGRQHLESEYYSATEHKNLAKGPRYERSHTLGQGTGFESPYGILYAPRYVNQTLQNAGIERYLRSLAATQPPGTTFRVTTRTLRIQRNGLPTGRLGEIAYRVDIVKGSNVQPFFEYSIQVGGSKSHPQVSTKPIQFANNPEAQSHAGRVPPPDILTQAINIII